MWSRLILPKGNASLLGQDQIEQDDRLWIRPERFCQTRSPEDDDPEAFKDDQALSAMTLFKLVTNHAMTICSPVRRV